MADPADTLRKHLANVVALGRRTPSGLAAMHEVDDTDLVALVPAVQALLNAGHELLALAAGEIARRDGGRKEPSLAQRHGHRNARALLADRAGISYGQASAHVAVGEFVRRGTTAFGEPVEPERPHVAEAVLAGELSIPLALLIDDTLEALHAALSPVELDALEAVLVEQATSGELSVKAFTVECKRLVAKTDPDGAKDRDEALRAKASIRHTALPNGLLRIVADLDPERAAYYLAAIRAKTNPHRTSTGAATGTGEPAEPDAPTAAGSGATGPQPDAMVTRLDASPRSARTPSRPTTGCRPGSTPPCWSASTSTTSKQAPGRRRSTGSTPPSPPQQPDGWPSTPRSSRRCSAAPASCSTKAKHGACSPKRSGTRSTPATTPARSPAATSPSP